MKNIRGVSLVDVRWLLDNIDRRIQDESFTLLLIDHLFDGISLKVRFSRLFDLAENKRETVAEMTKLGWWENGES